MLKKLLLFLLFPVLGYSQSLNLSIDPATAGNKYSTFHLGKNNVTFASNSVSFSGSGIEFNQYLSYGVTPDYSTVGILQNAVDGTRAFLLDPEGDTLAAYTTISLDYDDPSLAIYPLNTGSMLVRNNIANFTLYNPEGSIKTSGSGSSQSTEGESISEVSMDRNSKTVLIYTPKIKNGNSIGSQAQILKENNSIENIFTSKDREIKYAGVSGNGQFLVLVTTRGGTEDQVVIKDRFGNDLNTISTDEDLSAAFLSDDGLYITLHSSRRALVYSTLGGERIGSTSFRSPLVRARYFPEDETIVAITGSEVQNTEILKDVEFHAISLRHREIARRELSDALGTSPGINLELRRVGSGSYRLVGASKVVNIKASF